MEKRNISVFIYLPGYQFRQAEIYLKLRSCLDDSVINAAAFIGKFTNKNEFHRQCPPILVKDTNLIEIKDASCVYIDMTISPVK